MATGNAVEAERTRGAPLASLMRGMRARMGGIGIDMLCGIL
jgi:hypothetical protein